MVEFEPSSDAWNREWRSSSQVRSLESGLEEFKPSSDAWNWEWGSSSLVLKLGIGNGGVRAKFRRLESGMEEFEADTKSRLLESSNLVLSSAEITEFIAPCI